MVNKIHEIETAKTYRFLNPFGVPFPSFILTFNANMWRVMGD